MITLDEAIKHCKEMAEKNEEMCRVEELMGLGLQNTEMMKCARTHKQLAEWLIELKKLREQTRWIPTSERLPKTPGRYLTYIVNKHDTNYRYIMTCEYVESDLWSWFPDDECASDNVIAWMPLPEGYKEKGE